MAVDLDSKKDLILNMIKLQPTMDWYQQCIEMNLSTEEIEQLETDTVFLSDVKATLFIEKQHIMRKRMNAMELAASKGGWQGFDKLLQEIDRKMFSISKDIGNAESDQGEVMFYLPENGR